MIKKILLYIFLCATVLSAPLGDLRNSDEVLTPETGFDYAPFGIDSILLGDQTGVSDVILPSEVSGYGLTDEFETIQIGWLNGTAYVLSYVGTNTNVVSYLPIFAINEPTSIYPVDFIPFSYSSTAVTAATNTPEVSEWTRYNEPGDAMTISSEGTSSDDAAFLFAAENGMGLGAIEQQDGRMSAVRLPETLTTNDVYLMWPWNTNGFGYPVAINKTEAWWIGSDRVCEGQTFAVYGENLDLGDGLCQLFIDGYGWLENNGTYNPYKVEFDVPADLANDTYTVYAHNGHGQEFGWSQALELTVRDLVVYETDTNNWFDVTDYGATGDGVTDDSAAITALRDAVGSASGHVMYFPAGTYLTTVGVKVNNNQKLVGAGIDVTTIRLKEGFVEAFSSNDGAVFMYSDGTVEDLTINTGNTEDSFWGLTVVGGNYRENITLNRVKFDNYRDDGRYWGSNLSLASGEYAYVNDCEFLIRTSVYDGSKPHHYYRGCEFIGVEDVNTLMNSSPQYFVVEDCAARPLSVATTIDNTWAKSRWVSGGDIQYAYFGENHSTNMVPRVPDIEWTGTILETRVNTNYYDYIYGSYQMHDVRLASTFQSVRFKDWPDNSFLQYVEGDLEKKYSMVAMDHDSGWVSVYTRYEYQDMVDNLVVGGYAGMRESVDANAGEQWMWESTPHAIRESPASVIDASTIVFDSAITTTYNDFLMIVEGRGMGQVVEIESISDATVTLAEPLRVLPNTDSIIQIGDSCHKVAMYDNNINGHASWATNSTATCMVNIYGSGTDIIVDGNTISQLDGGIEFMSNPVNSSYFQEPQLFNRVENNTVRETHAALKFNNFDFITPPVVNGQSFYGFTVRNNLLHKSTTAFDYGTEQGGYQIDLNVVQDNTFSDCDTGIFFDSSVYGQALIDNTVSDNTLGMEFLSDVDVAFNGLTLAGNATNTIGTLPSDSLQVYVRKGDLGESSFDVGNGGLSDLVISANGQTVTNSGTITYNSGIETTYPITASNGDSSTFYVVENATLEGTPEPEPEPEPTNGVEWVSFDGVDDYLTIPTIAFGTNDNFTIEAVINLTDHGYYPQLVGGQSISYVIARFGTGTGLMGSRIGATSSWSTQEAPLDTWMTCTWERDAGDLTFTCSTNGVDIFSQNIGQHVHTSSRDADTFGGYSGRFMNMKVSSVSITTDSTPTFTLTPSDTVDEAMTDGATDYVNQGVGDLGRGTYYPE